MALTLVEGGIHLRLWFSARLRARSRSIAILACRHPVEARTFAGAVDGNPVACGSDGVR